MSQEISIGKIKILVKPNSKKDELLGFDVEKQAWKVVIAAPPRTTRQTSQL